MIDYLIDTRNMFDPDPGYEFFRRYGFWPEAEAEGARVDSFVPEPFDEMEAEAEMNCDPDDCPF
jgi:hypothetical protein